MLTRFDNICDEPPIPPLSGVLPRSLRLAKRNCGVSLATWSCVPLLESTQNDGEYWGGDVRRQERESRRGVGRREFGAQLAHEMRGRPMAFVEIHEYVGIARTDRRRRAVREVDAAVGKSQVVDDVRYLILWDHLADGCLDRIAKCGGFLDA